MQQNNVQDGTPKRTRHIAVDLDRTLAEYDKYQGPAHIGAPIPKMVAIVLGHLAAGDKVFIYTARVSEDDHSPEEITMANNAILDWCAVHLGVHLPITAVKSPKFSVFYDDRAVQVLPNTGILVQDLLEDVLDALHHDGGSTAQALGWPEAAKLAEGIAQDMWDRNIKHECLVSKLQFALTVIRDMDASAENAVSMKQVAQDALRLES